MKRRYKILGGVLGFFAVRSAPSRWLRAITRLALRRIGATGTGDERIQYHCYGGSEVLKLERVARPFPRTTMLLVEVHAAGVKPLDWHSQTHERERAWCARALRGARLPHGRRREHA